MKNGNPCVRMICTRATWLALMAFACSALAAAQPRSEHSLIRGVDHDAYLTAPASVWLEGARTSSLAADHTLELWVNGQRHHGEELSEVGHYFVEAKAVDNDGRTHQREQLYFRIVDEPWHRLSPWVDDFAVVESGVDAWRVSLRLLVMAEAREVPLAKLLPSSVKLFLSTVDGRNPITGAVTLARGGADRARLVDFNGAPVWRMDFAFDVPRDDPAVSFELVAAAHTGEGWQMFHTDEAPLWPVEATPIRWQDIAEALDSGAAWNIVAKADQTDGDGDDPVDPEPEPDGDCDLLDKVTLISKQPDPAVDRHSENDESGKAIMLYPDYTKPILVFGIAYDEDGSIQDDAAGGLGEWRWRIYPRNAETECVCEMTCQLAHSLRARARYREEDGSGTEEVAEVTVDAAAGTSSVCVTGAAIGSWTVKNSGSASSKPINLAWYENFLKGLQAGDNAWLPPLGGGLINLINPFAFFAGGSGQGGGTVNDQVTSMVNPNGTVGKPTGTAKVCTVDFLNQWRANLKFRVRGESGVTDDDAAAAYGFLEHYKHQILVHAKYKQKGETNWKTKDFDHRNESAIDPQIQASADRWLDCAIAQQTPDPDTGAGANCA